MKNLQELEAAVANMIRTIPADNNEQIDTHSALLQISLRIKRLKEFGVMVSNRRIRFAQ